jgi:hypothetical protein
MHDIIYDIILSYMILDMIPYITLHFAYFLCPAAADPRPAQRADETDDDHEQNRPMDFDEERDYADQGPRTDMDMDEDAEILCLLFLRAGPGRQRRGSVAARPLPQRGRRKAAAERIEHWTMIS